jgi:hypothetical protein
MALAKIKTKPALLCGHFKNITITRKGKLN